MLVLTRKTGQKLLIGSDVEVKILEIHGDSAKIGITAPKSVAIYREELYLEIMKTNQASHGSASNGSADVDALAKATQAAKQGKFFPQGASVKPTLKQTPKPASPNP